ncbi:MAG: tRNA (adenosine(37)-N6)-threonylcarbamoyltransferase complex ATPase subunit type 1 TsaE [Gammaproteobacteria bacterium]|nr:tRNA (adenosine(37)-N6)-threonylcarbamoyltransferase complex ATPase subunit type 1 TsaE [Gammaproteobacteria bacterium]
MSTLRILLKNEQATLDFGARLAETIGPPCIVFLHGELGAGKTTLVRGFLRALGYTGQVKSPTYTLVEPYKIADKQIYHFDLYRLENPEELELIGARDYFQNAICFVEWPEKGKNYLPSPDIVCYLDFKNSGRVLKCESKSKTGEYITNVILKPCSSD